MHLSKLSKRILFGILLLIGLALAGLEITSRVYQEHAATYFREQFTQKSNMVLQPFQTSISVWRHFPRITFSFQNISLLDTSGTSPVQVFWVKRASIAVPLSQLRLDRVKINRVDLEDVLFLQQVDSSGHKIGLKFKPKAQEDTTGGKLPFDIPRINITRGQIISQNKFKNSSFTINIEKANLSARLQGQRLKLEGDLNGRIGEFKNNRITLFRNQLFTANLHYDYLTDQKKGTFYNTHALINGNKITLKGSHTKLISGTGERLNITVLGYQPLIYLFRQLLPPQAQPFLNRFKTNSRLFFAMHMTGDSGPMQRPHNSISFKLKDGSVYLPAQKKYIREVQLNGEMNNGANNSLQTSQFTISNLSAKVAQGQLKVQLQVTDFIKPSFTMKSQGQIALTELAGFINLPFTHIAGGTIAGDFGFSGSMPDTLEHTNSNWLGNGTVQLQNATFRPFGLKVDCRAVNSQLQFSGNLLELQNLSGNLGGKPFKMQASIRNYFSYLFNEPGLILARADIYAQHLDTEWLSEDLLAYHNYPAPANALNARPVRLLLPAKPAGISSEGSFLAEKPALPLYRYVQKQGFKNRLRRYRKNPWDNTQSQVNLRVDNVNLPGGEKVKNLSVQVSQQNQKVKLNQMRFTTTGGGKASASGGFNLIASGISKPYLQVKLNYDFLDLQAFMQDLASLEGEAQPESPSSVKAQTQRKQENLNTLRQKDYSLNLQVRARKLQYLYLQGTNLFMEANLNKHRARLTGISLQAFGGKISARGEMRLDGTGDHFPVRLRSQVNNISLPQVFAFAESMKLDVLTSKNIRGTANCNLMVNTQLDRTFSPSFEGTVAYAKASFQKMELIEVAPIQHALRYLRKERTGHLYFEDATTNFVMRDYQFITPGLKLNSNLTAFELSGSYTMNGPAKLNLDVNVLSVLFGNNKRRIERIKSDSLAVQKPQRRQHLQLFREQEKYKVRLSDRKEREQSRQTLNKEFLTFLRQHQIDTVFTMNR